MFGEPACILLVRIQVVVGIPVASESITMRVRCPRLIDRRIPSTRRLPSPHPDLSFRWVTVFLAVDPAPLANEFRYIFAKVV